MEPMLIGGQRRPSASGAILEVFNPANSELIACVPDADAQDADDALAAADGARSSWARTPLHERVAIVHRFLALVGERRGELAELLTLETGKPIRESYEEVDETCAVFRAFAERVGNAMYGIATQLDLQQGLADDYLLTRREPLGVVVAILPFNFPIEMYAHKVGPALLAGNVVVVKPSEETPLTALLVTAWLHECGVPGGALQCLTGRGEGVGEALVRSPRADAITLTGSTEVGTHVYETGAKHLARVFLELGGNDPLIVLPDADLDLAVDMTVYGRTLNAGQCCSANKRMIVHRAVLDEFTARLLTKLDDWTPGDPSCEETKLGTVISDSAAQRAKAQVDVTVTEGGRVERGGDVSGAFFSPTVLVDVTREMSVANDMEIFAPVFPIITVDTDEDAIAVANQTTYGLSAGVFTHDADRAFRYAASLACGLVVINGCSLFRPLIHHHGGYKRSGIGREGVDITIQEMTQVKGIMFRGVLAGWTNGPNVAATVAAGLS
jgi:succinate-semialdehyde dehydrogenase/glutarate-semialdehyde dehydrogenase